MLLRRAAGRGRGYTVTGTRLTYQARVLILQATVWSMASFLALYRTPPLGLLDKMYAASRYFLWKNRLPLRATVDTEPQGYHCACRASRTTLAMPRSRTSPADESIDSPTSI